MSRQCCHKLPIGNVTFYCVELEGHQCPHAYTVNIKEYQQLHERTEKAEVELAAAKADADRYRWLRDAKALTLRSDRLTAWTRQDGSKFTSSHLLCADGRQYAPQETLDAAIDAAIGEGK